jgi:hypothetical protein
MDITKTYIFLYKLKKCLLWQFKRINIMATFIICLLLCVVIFQQLYYPRIIKDKDEAIKTHLNYLQFAYNNITNAVEDLQAQVEDYKVEDWKTHIKEIKLYLDALDTKVSYFESSIQNYYSPSRTKRQKLLF